MDFSKANGGAISRLGPSLLPRYRRPWLFLLAVAMILYFSVKNVWYAVYVLTMPSEATIPPQDIVVMDVQRMHVQKDAGYLKNNDISVGDQILCRYDGHCPVGATCAASRRSKLGGICEPVSPETKLLSLDDSCVQLCRTELEWDESFFYDASIRLHAQYAVPMSQGRPRGCVLVYERQPAERRPEEEREAWKRIRQTKRVVRIDPWNITTANDSSVLWSAFCYNPCQTDLDCSIASGEAAFECVSGACQRLSEYWSTDQDINHHDMVLVTGASEGFFLPLRNFCASSLFWAPHNAVVVYNLGLTEAQLEKIETWPNVKEIKWRDGIPKYYPEHVREGRKYAWKPLAINESVHEYKNIFWMDAGSTWTGPITPAEEIVHRRGIFLVKGQDEDMKPTANPLTFKWFNETKGSFRAGPSYAGGIQGHLYPSRYIDTIVIPNAECALQKDCISPPESYPFNHKFDQTTLSILAYKPLVQVPHNTEFVAAHRKQLNRNFTGPNGIFIWTARKSCRYYIKQMEDMFPDVEEVKKETNMPRNRTRARQAAYNIAGSVRGGAGGGAVRRRHDRYN